MFTYTFFWTFWTLTCCMVDLSDSFVSLNQSFHISQHVFCTFKYCDFHIQKQRTLPQCHHLPDPLSTAVSRGAVSTASWPASLRFISAVVSLPSYPVLHTFDMHYIFSDTLPSSVGAEDSYTVTCGMPLPCLAGGHWKENGSYCPGEWMLVLVLMLTK